MKLSTNEIKLLAKLNSRITKVTRRSDREYDLSLNGICGDFQVSFTAWLPLIALTECDLVTKSRARVIAAGCSVETIWQIFDEYVLGKVIA